jgi:plasmid stability protein
MEAQMADLLIRNIEPGLKMQIKEKARKHGRSLSHEAKELLRRAVAVPEDSRKLGTLMFESIRPEDRGDDLVFEYKGDFSEPPDFK